MEVTATGVDTLDNAMSDAEPDAQFGLTSERAVCDLFFASLGLSQSDLNLVGNVDFADFLFLSGGFGQSGTRESGDVNGDGVIDFSDFLLLSKGFGN